MPHNASLGKVTPLDTGAAQPRQHPSLHLRVVKL